MIEIERNYLFSVYISIYIHICINSVKLSERFNNSGCKVRNMQQLNFVEFNISIFRVTQTLGSIYKMSLKWIIRYFFPRFVFWN